MEYQPGMEETGGDIMDRVLELRRKYRPEAVEREAACCALAKDRLDIDDFGALLSLAAGDLLEPMAERARDMTARHFGNGVTLYTPLYIANYCDNRCVYCGFNADNHIRRAKLSLDGIRGELKAIAATGLDEILLLTGESRGVSDVGYIGEAVRMAAGLFSAVCLEVYPLNTDEYAYLHSCGADYVSVYQETYAPDIYDAVHIDGPKRSFPYRFNAQERAIRGGMRGVSFGALLGLGDFYGDVYAAALHALLIQKKHPWAEIAFSVPRLRAFKANGGDSARGNANASEGELRAGNAGVYAGSGIGVGERLLFQAMLALRLFMPFAGISISTRERAGFRDRAAGLCATKMSAGVNVGVGGRISEQTGDEQFYIADTRGVDDIHSALVANGLQPIYTDYVRTN